MKTQYGKVFLLGCIIACMNGCELSFTLDECDTSEVPKCIQNIQYRCNEHNQWEKTDDACDNTDTSNCTSHETECYYLSADNSIGYRCVNGQDTACQDDGGSATSCNETKSDCGVCINAQTQCRDQHVYTCISGTWTSSEDDAQNTECGDCSGDIYKCEDKKEYHCENNTWKEREKACEIECGMTKCNDCKNGSKKCESATLYRCISNQWEIEKKCLDSCDETQQACKEGGSTNPDDKCTADRCSDDNSSLIKCNDGIESTETCTNGCDAATNKCKDAQTPSDKCTADVCKDERTLLVCNDKTGTTTESLCNENQECKDGSCVDKTQPNKCSANVCKDANTLFKCNEDGSITAIPCPNGCDATKNTCKEGGSTNPDDKCTADKCDNVSCKNDSECGECLNDEHRCSEDGIEICISGKWVLKTTCSDCETSDSDLCESCCKGASECTPGETICAKKNNDSNHFEQKTCNSKGKWDRAIPCPGQCDNQNTYCISECDNNKQYYCKNNEQEEGIKYSCDSNHHINEAIYCQSNSSTASCNRDYTDCGNCLNGYCLVDRGEKQIYVHHCQQGRTIETGKTLNVSVQKLVPDTYIICNESDNPSDTEFQSCPECNSFELDQEFLALRYPQCIIPKCSN